MEISKEFQAAIKSYLDERAKTDELFSKSYAKEGKNIEECCKYILGEVYASKCMGFTDAEVFGMAVHYFDEDDIELKQYPNAVQVKVNHHVEPSKDKPKQAEVIKPSQPTEKPKATASPKKEEPKKREYIELSLFD